MVIAVVVLALLYSNGSLSVSTPAPTGGTGACPLSQVMSGMVVTTNLANNQPALVGSQTINVYTPGMGLPVFTGTSSGSAGVTIPASGNVNCNVNLIAVSGDDSIYLRNGTAFSTGKQSVVPVVVKVLTYGAPTLTVSNAPSQAFASTTFVSGAVAGLPVTDVQMHIKAGAGVDSEGPLAIEFTYNGADISSISLQGGSSIAPSLLPNPTFGAGQNAEAAFLIPAGSYFGVQALNPVITMSGVYNGLSETVGIQMSPATDYWDSATGQLMTGVYVNPVTQQALVTPVKVASAITIT